MSRKGVLGEVNKPAPSFVHLAGGEQENLPSVQYIRVIAQHLNSQGELMQHHFALHVRAARFCRLLDTLLDATDVDLRSQNDTQADGIPPLVMPQATRRGCECVFHYLEFLTTRVPTLLSKPLKAPLEELTQPWEMRFLLEECLGVPCGDGSVLGGAKGSRNDAAHEEQPQPFHGTENLFKALSKQGSQSLDCLLEVAMLSDFLLIEPLRDLSCAFLASLALSAPSSKELLQLCNLERPLTDQELEPLYAQLPFLRYQEEL